MSVEKPKVRKKKTIAELEKDAVDFKRKAANINATMAFADYTDAMKKAEDRATTKKFSELFADSKKVLTTFVPELGCNIDYRLLTAAELTDIQALGDDDVRSNEMLYIMLTKVDDSITREEFDDMDQSYKNFMSNAVVRKSPFLVWTAYEGYNEEIANSLTLKQSLDIDTNTS